MTFQSDAETSRPAVSEVDRAYPNGVPPVRSAWSYLPLVLAVVAIAVLGFVLQDDAPEPAFRASSTNPSTQSN
jgi:hypothetical protein